ncbi:MAG TPA: GntR family transcriptional regulator [Actinomycetota bacterium]|nr:GntR family transcriptional regulator [Actinomycetota bacterium]
MILRVDPDSPVPPYEQIRSQVLRVIASGVLKEGQRLPAIRQLASDLDLAGGTVARAYRELERDGLIVTRGRHGTFVNETRDRAGSANRQRELAEAAGAFAVQAAQLGVDAGEALKVARQALESLPT